MTNQTNCVVRRMGNYCPICWYKENELTLLFVAGWLFIFGALFVGLIQ